jgi:hypothetical protein
MNRTACILSVLLIFVFWGGNLPAYGNSTEIHGLVLRTDANGDVVINKGREDNIQVGTILYVTRLAKPIGKIKVAVINQYNSACTVEEILPGNQFNRGDAISSRPYVLQPVVPERRTSTGTSTFTHKSAPNEVTPYTTAEQRFKDSTRKHIRSFHFKQKGGFDSIMGPFSLVGPFTPVFVRGTLGGSSAWNWIFTGYSALSTYEHIQSAKKMFPSPGVYLELTYWSPEYLDAFAEYQAEKEAIADQNFITAAKDNIFRQKGMDKYYVFQVRIMNPGPLHVQFAPFSNRFHLKPEKNNVIMAEHYDQSLDASLAPNQMSNGYVYFRKYNHSGIPTVIDDTINVELNNIMGNTKRIRF